MAWMKFILMISIQNKHSSISIQPHAIFHILNCNYKLIYDSRVLMKVFFTVGKRNRLHFIVHSTISINEGRWWWFFSFTPQTIAFIMPTRLLPEGLKEIPLNFFPNSTLFPSNSCSEKTSYSIAKGFLSVRFDFFFFKFEGDFFYQMCNLFFPPHATEKYRKHTNNNISTKKRRERRRENFLIPLSIFQTALIIVFLYIVCALSIFSTLPPKIWRFAFNIEKKEIFKNEGECGSWRAASTLRNEKRENSFYCDYFSLLFCEKCFILNISACMNQIKKMKVFWWNFKNI